MAQETCKIYDQIGRGCPEILWISLTSCLDRVLGNLLGVQAWVGIWSRWTQRCLPTQPFWHPEISVNIKLPLFHQLSQPYPLIAAEVVDIVAWTQLYCLSCMVAERQSNEKSPIRYFPAPTLSFRGVNNGDCSPVVFSLVCPFLHCQELFLWHPSLGGRADTAER